MVKYALKCDHCELGFEGWFSSSSAYDEQRARGEISCPNCGAATISKQIMAPAVRDSRGGPAIPLPDREKFAEMAKAVRDHVSTTHEYVGDRFADTARAMHYGETEQKAVWGEATLKEAKELVEEGVPALPLPGPIAPEKPVDQKKLN